MELTRYKSPSCYVHVVVVCSCLVSLSTQAGVVGWRAGDGMSNDLVGVWEVALSDGVHRIELEHGTTTGKRVIHVDGKVLNRLQQ